MIAAALDEFLRSGGRRGSRWGALPAGTSALVVLGCSACYGVVMAAYHGFAGERLWMVAFGAIKVPMLFLATMLLAVPCFYVLNLVLGVGDDFRAVWAGLVDYQIAVAVQLAALVPVTVFVNLSYGDYQLAQLWSTLLFGIAAWNAQRSLDACYAPLVRVHRAHVPLRRFWFVLYAFVGIQMAWTLRPFVGNPELEVQFLRDHVGNAYVEVARLLFGILGDLAGGD